MAQTEKLRVQQHEGKVLTCLFTLPLSILILIFP